ncbi:S-AdoMet-dependent methyltransferase [Elysia marginata]|uniref:S-AdoMet-dependent methyltransferase n=1 Tax=Elysia marginata TaxID=1093978 RepID=A0AAV4J7E6_9GAST|nr:S-AdoMet-dependent methyltransferase [Elysia marginata]
MSATEVAMARAIMSDSVDKTKMYVSLDQSKAYSEFRPRYSEELFKTIADYCRETMPDLGLAVDVGCGPGMSTLGFCKYFKKVIGIDVSETQIACAPKDVANCEFKVGYSHQLPFIKSKSVDLFCSGESFNLMPEKE